MLIKNIKLGFILGVLAGLIYSWDNLRHDLHYSLYSNAANNLSFTLIQNILLAIALTFIVYFLYLLFFKYKKVYRIIFVSVCLIILGYYLHLNNFDLGIWYFIQGAFESSTPSILGAGALIIGGVFILKHLKPADNSKKLLSDESESMEKGPIKQKPSFFNFNKAKKLFNPTFKLSASLTILMILAAISFRIYNYFTIAGKPNVIIIMADTTRSDHISSYGYFRNTTPNIDRFAGEATRFKRAIAQSSMTSYSVPSFLSSRHPFGDNQFERCMLAEVLRNKGYYTASVISNPLAETMGIIDKGFVYFDDRMNEIDVSSPGVTEIAQDCVDRAGKRPFFLFALYMDPHSAYIKHKEFDYSPGYKGKYADFVPLTPSGSMLIKQTPSPGEIRQIKAIYDSEISFTDKYIGQLIDYLKKKDLYNNSVVVFLADHGEEFYDHGGFFHGDTLYNEVLSVPCVIKTPHQKKPQQVGGNFSLINLYPTVLDTIGIDSKPYRPEGRKIALKGLKDLRERIIFSSVPEHEIRCVEVDGMKLIQTGYSDGNKSNQLIKIKIKKIKYFPKPIDKAIFMRYSMYIQF